MTAEAESTEVGFARKLASVDAKKRRQAVKALSAWVSARAAAAPGGVLPEIEIRKLWRAFFFCMWLADKAPVQNDLASKLAAIVHCFKSAEAVR